MTNASHAFVNDEMLNAAWDAWHGSTLDSRSALRAAVEAALGAADKLAEARKASEFPTSVCTAWEDCNHDHVCHDPVQCGFAEARAEAEKAEAERVKEWNRRRDAEASRDVERAAADTMRSERDVLAADKTRLVEAFSLLRLLRDNIGAASLARNILGMSIRDRVDIFIRDASAFIPAPSVKAEADADWLRDTAMAVMLATEVEEAVLILRRALANPARQEGGQ